MNTAQENHTEEHTAGPDQDRGGGGASLGVFRQPTSGKEGENFISNNDPSGDVLEKQHAEALGLSRDVLVKLRGQHLTEGDHFKKEGWGIVLTASGVAELSKHLEVSAPEKKEAAAVPLTVVRLVRNQRVVIASNGTRDDLTVRVRSSANLKKGMVLQACTPVKGTADLYQFCGRLPRSRGRW